MVSPARAPPSHSSTKPPVPPAPAPVFSNPEHTAAANFLYQAATSGRLGSGPIEPDSDAHSLFFTFLYTIPWTMLFVQFVWASAVLAIAWALRNQQSSTSFSSSYWTSRLNVTSSVSYGVGWALFVLLGFFIREASQRFREAQDSIHIVSSYLRQLIRLIRLQYPANTWHDGDYDRIAAHIVAYPIALKMTLRGEREREQLEPLLHPDDVSDVLEADLMHTHCLRVVRAYLATAEDDGYFVFKHSNCTRTYAGVGTRYFNVDLVDSIDMTANAAVRIAQFSPAKGYINHLQIFLYIWMLFLPLALVKTSGWFTVLWAVLINYGVGMLFTIAQALNEPYGHDLQDVKLNRLCSQMSYEILVNYSSTKVSMKELVRRDHCTPIWLEEIPKKRCDSEKITDSMWEAFWRFLRNIYKSILGSRTMMMSLSAFTLWVTFVVVLTWGVSRNREPPRSPGDRWWSVYVPVSTGTTEYVSLGIFLLLGFWMNDAYGRYWRGLQIWQTTMRDDISITAYRFLVMCNRGLWHQRDRERIFSHFAALPFVTKETLRKSRDLSEIEDLLDLHDLQALAEAPDMPFHCISVILSYLHSEDSIDSEVVESGLRSIGTAIHTTIYNIWYVEKAITECIGMQRFKISPSFTIHLQLFTFFWLMLLPLSLVVHDGFLSFVFLLPIAYSIINLLIIGSNLADPFGYDDEDIPLEKFCHEIKDNLHDLYHEGQDGYIAYIHKETYDRAKFTPGSLQPILKAEEASKSKNGDNLKKTSAGQSALNDHSTLPTFRTTLELLSGNLPAVSSTAMIVTTVWTVIAVLASYGLSKLWKNDDRGSCQTWCSPIDVSTTVLANTGFALFMILSFRASDAISRYEEGANMIFDIEKHIRALAIEMTNIFRDEFFHSKDKERIVAHIIQVPLRMRDVLLGYERLNPVSREGLLNDADYNRFMAAQDPLEYLLRTVESYILVQDSYTREKFEEIGAFRAPLCFSLTLLGRIDFIRTTFSTIMGIKEYPVIPSYTRHQYVFTTLWLALLPLSMTKQTGFFTILWAPLISYGVFGLEAIAGKLVDPYGRDSVDIPVDRLLHNAANAVLDGVHSTGWDSFKYTRPSFSDLNPQIGAALHGNEVYDKYALARLDDKDVPPEDFGQTEDIIIYAGHPPKMVPSIYAHIVRSVPWRVLFSITLWTTIACGISFALRDKNAVNVRWWKSRISVSTSVATYVSFAAFMLLGFYVQFAFQRYHEAGSVWADNLRAACHALSVQIINYFPDGTIHDNDRKRIMGHIAAIPLVFKQELRDSRDIREIKGLVSQEDFARIQTAESMVAYCVDVVRAYFSEFICRPERLKKKSPGVWNRDTFLNMEIRALETAIRACKFLKVFVIAPGFIVLLNFLLGLWFLLLPFVLAEISGWFTILWVPIIAYGLLGMYAVAAELQGPFGLDLNDLDLDSIADNIVEDILFVDRNYKAGNSILVREAEPAPIWEDFDLAKKLPSLSEMEEEPVLVVERLKQKVHLALHAVSLWQLALVVLWAAACVTGAWGLSHGWKITGKICESPWFCSYIAIDDALKDFVGFALFLLLGFRLYDSHFRYVTALRLWQDGVIGFSRIVSNRILQSYEDGWWHEGDLKRICGHIAAFSICSMGSLRNEDNEERLKRVLGADDVRRILMARDQVDYCIDVVRAYLLEAEWVLSTKPEDHGAPSAEHHNMVLLLRKLSYTAFECQRMVRVPMPFGYIQHLRIFMIIWLILLPLGLVEATGWLTILWVLLIAYGVIGIERWSEELSDPFGYDLSDVPLEDLCDRVVSVVMNNLTTLKEGGAGLLVRAERVPAFQGRLLSI